MAKLCEACGAASAVGKSPYCRYCGLQPRTVAEPRLDADGFAKKPVTRAHMALQSLWLIGPATLAILVAHPWS